MGATAQLGSVLRSPVNHFRHTGRLFILMANWQEQIELNKVLTRMNEQHDLSRLEEDCPIEVKDAIANEIKKSRHLCIFMGRVKKCKSIAAVNRVLDAIFDRADSCFVWCGLP